MMMMITYTASVLYCNLRKKHEHDIMYSYRIVSYDNTHIVLMLGLSRGYFKSQIADSNQTGNMFNCSCILKHCVIS